METLGGAILVFLASAAFVIAAGIGLARYGDDYVEWVKEMPEGLDKETAMNSLIWATREQNPEEARKLNDALYPPKSK